MAIFLSFSSFHRPNGRLATYECVAALSNFRFEHSHPAFLSLQRRSVFKNLQKTPNLKFYQILNFWKLQVSRWLAGEWMGFRSVIYWFLGGENLRNCNGPRWDYDYLEPCTQVEKVIYTYDEYDKSGNRTGSGGNFQLTFNFQGKTYMEIKQRRDYDFQSLIGNAGGYLGLFLGVCLLQLPQLLLDGYNYVK